MQESLKLVPSACECTSADDYPTLDNPLPLWEHQHHPGSQNWCPVQLGALYVRVVLPPLIILSTATGKCEGCRMVSVQRMFFSSVKHISDIPYFI